MTEIKRSVLSPRPDNTPVKSAYTLGILWDKLTPKVQVEVLRDCLQLSEACRHLGSDFFVCLPNADLAPFFEASRISLTGNAQSASYWRIYRADKFSEILPPEQATSFDYVDVDEGVAPMTPLRKDTVFPNKFPQSQDGMPGPDSIPWQAPPHSSGNPFQWDF